MPTLKNAIAHRALLLARILLNLAAVGAGLATFCGLFGRLWWGLELLDHPRGQYCLILLTAIAANVATSTRTLVKVGRGSIGGRGSRGGKNTGDFHNDPNGYGDCYRLPLTLWVWVFLVPLVLNFALILPLFVPSLPVSTQTEDTLRVLHLNLDRHNTNFAGVAGYIQQADADIVFLQEVTPTWLSEIESQVSRYNIRLSRPQNDSQGVALLVPVESSPNIEIVAAQIIHLPAYSTRPLIETQIQWGETETMLLSLHVTRPRNRGTSQFQQVEFASLAQWSQQQAAQNRQAIAIGDFNTTPWSDRFRQLLDESGLTNSNPGWGPKTTWPANFPPPLRIPIDLCLHSRSLTSLSRKTGPHLGSDHLPLEVEFGMKNEV